MKKTTEALVILLHGVAAFGYDLDPLARVLRRALPGADIVAPDAPFVCEGPGRQWYDLDGVTPENRPGRIAAARPVCDRLLDEIIDSHGFGHRWQQVALVGFSQGATTLFDAYASGRRQAGAIVLLSGRFVKPAPFVPATGTPVLLVHGAEDPAVPPENSAHARDWLSAAGVSVEMHTLKGVGHAIAPQAARLTARFLQGALHPSPNLGEGSNPTIAHDGRPA